VKFAGGVLLTLLILASAGGSFVATSVWQDNSSEPAPQPAPPMDTVITDWLDLTPVQGQAVTTLESAYREERRELEQAVASERETLAAMFEDPAVSNDEIIAQVERVIRTSNALERRTARFLVDVRPHLDSAQQHRLLKHFATGVRAGGGHRWRHGQQGGTGSQERRGGPPPGRGRRRGRGGP